MKMIELKKNLKTWIKESTHLKSLQRNTIVKDYLCGKVQAFKDVLKYIGEVN